MKPFISGRGSSIRPTNRLVVAALVVLVGAGLTSVPSASAARTGQPVQPPASRGGAGAPTDLTVAGVGSGQAIDDAHPAFSWQLDDRRRGAGQSAYEVVVSRVGTDGQHPSDPVWDSGRVVSDRSTYVPYRGPALEEDTTYSWRVRTWDEVGERGSWSRTQTFDVALLDGVDSWDAQWMELPPLALVRHDFTLPRGRITRARLYVASRGLYEARLNGAKVGDHVLDSTWTDWSERTLYRTFDVTRSLRAGAQNTLGAFTGRGIVMRGDLDSPVRGIDPEPLLGMRLSVDYADGRHAAVTSAEDGWTVGTSPVTEDDPRWGEAYDARAEQPGWDRPGFDDDEWEPVTTVGAVGDPDFGRVQADPTEPIRVIETLRPTSERRVGDGVRQYDFGRNVSGWVRITARAPAGTEAHLLEGEILVDGRVSTDNVQLAPVEERPRQDYRYTFRGDDRPETWEPRFVYGSFRYLEVSGLPAGAHVQVQARHLHSDVDQSGSFTSCDPLIDRIQSAVVLTQRNNLHGYPEDCPSREKKGWLGDAAVSVDEAMANYDVEAVMSKWLGDIATSQRADGSIPAVAPSRQYGDIFTEDPNWAEALPVVMWEHWMRYGDRRVLARNYPVLARWLEHLTARTDEDGVLTGEFTYGSDWLAIEHTDKNLLHTGALLEGLDVGIKAARALGDEDGAARWQAEFDRVEDGFNSRFWDASSGSYGTTQAANAYPLALGIVPSDRVQSTLDTLVTDIRLHEDHLTTGFVGTLRVFRALHRYERDDVLLDVAQRTDYPSFGYMVTNGPGTIWEKWNNSSSPDGTSSKNHPGLGGSIGEWFYEALAGIEPTGPGFSTATIAPRIDLDLPCAAGTVGTPHGPIRSAWRRHGEAYQLDVHVPVGTTAEVVLPLMDHPDGTLSESGRSFVRDGRSIRGIPGVTSVRVEHDRVRLTVLSGGYAFSFSPSGPADRSASVETHLTAADPVGPADEAEVHALVRVTSRSGRDVSLFAQLPDAWQGSVSPAMIHTDGGGIDERIVTLHVRVPWTAAPGHVPVKLIARSPGLPLGTDETTLPVAAVAKEWTFDEEGDQEGWNAANQLEDVGVSGGRLTARSTGGDPWFTHDGLDLDLSAGLTLRIEYSPSASGGRVYWSTDAEPGYSEARSAGLTITNGEGPTRAVAHIPATEAHHLTSLRLDPQDGPGEVSLDSITVLRPPT